MKIWTTTRWELEHWSVQGGIEPLITKYHQAYNLLIQLNFISCDLPNVGSLLIYLIKQLIDNSTIYFSNRIVGELRKRVELYRKDDM